MNIELKQFLDLYLKEDTDTKTVTVFPLPCGTGKSEYITHLLADALQNNYGLIVVTDEINRLNSYTSNKQTEQLTEYIERNKNRISVLSSANISDEIKATPYKPMILMTTQRYFNLTRDEIITFTSEQNYKRNKIIFDEKIYLIESQKITVKELDSISTTFKMALDNTVNQDDKQWLISQYDAFNAKMQAFLTQNEKENNNTNNFKREVYFNSDSSTISDDDNRFNILMQKYKHNLRKHNVNITKKVEAINKLLIDGAVTSQKIKSKKSNQEYKNYFTVVTNNADRLINVGAKVFVLDGTADISPEYQLNCVNLVDCGHFKRDLSKLTINIVNVNTSKDRLTRKGKKTEQLIKAIINYIHAQPQNIDTVFTYNAIEDKFMNVFKNVNHFGNIKGSNQYRDEKHICQVGLNRWSELVYVLYANEIEQYNHPDKSFNHRIYDKETIDNIRCSLLLADFEQNLYRCKIRNKDNLEPCIYTLICSTTEQNGIYENYQPLVNMIKTRYEKLGATVNVINTPAQFKLLKASQRNTQNKTSIQKFDDWYKMQPSGRLFKRADILTECNLTVTEYKSIKNSGILNDLKTGKQGIYAVK